MTVNVSFQMEEEERDALKKIAKENMISFSALLRQIAHKYLEDQKKQDN